MPSLSQLDQAVREFISENPTDVVTVVVDASFGHRIDPSELPAFEEAEAAGEVVSPPAGAIGRGDAFLLRIAEKTGATVLSNDSFQEFHGEHTWLFDKGRLIGGKPVPGVGWIFMDRTPVRGAKSREVTKEAKRKKRVDSDAPVLGASSKGAEAKPRARPKAVDRAIARATEEVVEPKAGGKSRRRRSTSPPAEPVNEPLAFITFIAAHPLGSDVVGSVLEYSSHGAFIEADGARCYIPLSAMGTPPPRRAREVVNKGEPRTFVVQAFDPQRRGIELALPGFAKIAGAPTAETVEAEISAEAPPTPPRKRARGAKKAAPTAAPTPQPGPETPAEPERETPAAEVGAAVTGTAAKKAAVKKVAAQKVAAQKPAAAPAKKAAAKKEAAKKAATKKTAAKKPAVAAPAKKAATKKTATKQAAAVAPAKKAAAKKVAKKVAAAAAPAKRAGAARSARKSSGAPAQNAEPPAS